MSSLPEVSNFDVGVYQIETTDPVLGGPSGVTNLPAKNLANRTLWLKNQLEALAASIGTAATEAWVLEQLQALDHKQSVRAATVANITLSGIQTIDGVTLVVGDRVLVKNQSSAAENGPYVVASLNWTRAPDGNTGAKLNSGAVFPVEEGTLQGNSRWQLTTDGPVSVGSTALVFADVTAGFAPLASPNFTGSPLAPTPPQFDADTSLATTEFVQRALGNSRGFLGVTTSTTLTAAHCGLDIFASSSSGAITMTLPAASALPAGSKFKVINTGLSDVIVTRVGGDTIVLGTTSNAVTAVTLKAGDWIELASLGTGALWYHTGGTAQLAYAGAFGSSLAASGHQKLPSGLIFQWGTITQTTNANGFGPVTVTLPIAFSTAVLCLTGNLKLNGNLNGSAPVNLDVISLTQIAVSLDYSTSSEGTGASRTVYWFAIGY